MERAHASDPFDDGLTADVEFSINSRCMFVGRPVGRPSRVARRGRGNASPLHGPECSRISFIRPQVSHLRTGAERSRAGILKDNRSDLLHQPEHLHGQRPDFPLGAFAAAKR